MKQIATLILLCLIICGCGHNRYNEYKTWGVSFQIPFGDLGSMGVCIGSMESTVAMVRGGSSFNSETIAGEGLFSAAGGTAKITSFRSNEQLNERNIVKVMESPEVPAEAKIELAKNLNHEAPDFKPSAMQIREATLYANGFTNELTNQFKPTGVDKVVDGTVDIVTNTVNSVEEIIDHTTDTITDTTDAITDAVSDTTGNITKGQAWAAIGTFLLIILLVMLKKFKSDNGTTTKTKSPSPKPPSKSPTDTINPPNLDDDGETDETAQEEVEPQPPRKKSKAESVIDAGIAALEFWDKLSPEKKDYLKRSASTVIGTDKKKEK